MKTIVFDFDGTIVNSLPFVHQRMVQIIKEMKLSNLPDNQIIDEIRSQSYPELIKKFRISWLKIPFILAKVSQAQKDLYKQIDKIKFFPEAKQVLELIKKQNIQLGILSSNIQENIKKFLELNDLQIFDFIYCEKTIFNKEKAIINMLNKQNLIKDEVIYVGDEVRDIEACKKSGIKIIAVTWGLNNSNLLIKHKPDFIINKPEEILRILGY